MKSKSRKKAILALASGEIFEGISVGFDGEANGEVVFNTSMTGYQEILTDPSYYGQMLCFTYPHIGNVGVNDEDVESSKVQISGLIVRSISEHYSNFRATKSLREYLVDNKIVAISEIDTRSLVLTLREKGAQMGIISTEESDSNVLVQRAKNLESLSGKDLVKHVTTKESYLWNSGVWKPTEGFPVYTDEQLKNRPLVSVIDFGIKYNMLRLLTDVGFRVKVYPASTTASEILSDKPAAVFLSNGPGDPSAVTYGIETAKELVGKLPIFGICLGHQILGLALGAKTFKLKFGHRGANQPVKDLSTGKVEITVQNHGFATALDTVPENICVSHLNLNDNTVEGFNLPELMAFSTQHHPECSPGPRDSQYMFNRFADLVINNKGL